MRTHHWHDTDDTQRGTARLIRTIEVGFAIGLVFYGLLQAFA